MNYFKLIVAVVATVFLLACDRGGDKFMGDWKAPDGYELIITKAGNAYNIDDIHRNASTQIGGITMPGFGNKQTWTALYNDGNLSAGTPFGAGVLFVYADDGHIIYDGRHYYKN